MPPANLTTLLSTLRAPIFNTAVVSSNARTGAKYLRKRLRGPSVLNYIPVFPRLRDLNSPTSKYAGWQGDATPEQPGGLYQLPKHMVVADGFEEIGRREKPGPPIKQRAVVKKAGWLESEAEYTRFDDIAKRRARGKGAPPKGEWEQGNDDVVPLLRWPRRRHATTCSRSQARASARSSRARRSSLVCEWAGVWRGAWRSAPADFAASSHPFLFSGPLYHALHCSLRGAGFGGWGQPCRRQAAVCCSASRRAAREY
ncbi:hypothetical protein VHUM_02086 [Vanrija humicola]|uniref:Small ribosomal subunit protein mS33 n=1 Tax=Vanrija humicola TaxID=5417 RepID=A0A7D8Z3F4_VANHU|nr:hypothetical protein VHUM_02086 [Vanrija humicola]